MAKHYKNIDAIVDASLLDLMLVDEIGERIAESVVQFFGNKNNIEIINKLKENNLQFEINTENATYISNKLENKIFVVSGVFETYSRDELKRAIEDNGGKVGSSISAKTNFVIAGDNMGPAKLDKATKLGVVIITEFEFNNLIN